MMRSATAFLPDSMITFMNLDRSTEPNFGSGRMSRLGTSRRRGMSHFLWLQLVSAFASHLGRSSGPPTYSAAPKIRHENQARLEAGLGHKPEAGLQAGFPISRSVTPS